MKTNDLKNKRIIIENGNADKKWDIDLKSPPKEFMTDTKNFKKFSKLKVNYAVKSTDKKDLPEEFSEEICKFIDIFRRKTVNEKKEWNFYIDYENDEIIHCIYGEPTEVTGWINTSIMDNSNILSLHNHITGTYSAPSPENFEILGHGFENYEIICAEDGYWILKAKGYFKNRNLIQDEIYGIFQSVKQSDSSNKSELYENKLTNFINNLNQKIELTKIEYR